MSTQKRKISYWSFDFLSGDEHFFDADVFKRGIEGIYTALTTGGTEVSRIRVRGKDINKMDVTIDSLNGKKRDEVTVKLQENGIVDSYSFFSKIEELLGVTI